MKEKGNKKFQELEKAVWVPQLTKHDMIKSKC